LIAEDPFVILEATAPIARLRGRESIMPEVRVNGVSLHYDVAGKGPSVILVHGSWGDADNWAQVLPLLADRCRVVSYDRRGHSRSERPSAQGSVHEDVDDLAALVERLYLDPVFVCGNSFGALITLRLAYLRPELVRGVVVHEPPGTALLDDPRSEPMAKAVTEALAPVRGLLEAGQDAAAAELFVETVAFGKGAWAQLPAALRETFVLNAPTYLDELQDPDAIDLDLAALKAYWEPALLTSSDNSPPIFAPILDRIASALPQSERHVYAGGGHAPHAAKPEEYAAVTLPYVLAGQ
jgi:pimeloyl-ACP methyl ester carboxylesterase